METAFPSRLCAGLNENASYARTPCRPKRVNGRGRGNDRSRLGLLFSGDGKSKVVEETQRGQPLFVSLFVFFFHEERVHGLAGPRLKLGKEGKRNRIAELDRGRRLYGYARAPGLPCMDMELQEIEFGVFVFGLHVFILRLAGFQIHDPDHSLAFGLYGAGEKIRTPLFRGAKAACLPPLRRFFFLLLRGQEKRRGGPKTAPIEEATITRAVGHSSKFNEDAVKKIIPGEVFRRRIRFSPRVVGRRRGRASG